MGFASPRACGGVWSLCTFDAPHWPYGSGKARDYLAALSPDALRLYSRVVQPLDFVLPALLCIWLRAAAARWAVVAAVRPLGALAIFYLTVDYLENGMVRVMLNRPDGNFPDAVAMVASGLTILKWVALAGFAVMLATRLDRGGGQR